MPRRAGRHPAIRRRRRRRSTPMSPARTVLHLADNSFNYNLHGRVGLRAARGDRRCGPCVTLRYSRLEEGVAAVDRLATWARNDRPGITRARVTRCCWRSCASARTLRTLTGLNGARCSRQPRAPGCLPRLALDAERLGLTTGLPDVGARPLASARVRGREYERVVQVGDQPDSSSAAADRRAPGVPERRGLRRRGLPCGVGRVVADVDILVAEADIPRVQRPP